MCTVVPFCGDQTIKFKLNDPRKLRQDGRSLFGSTTEMQVLCTPWVDWSDLFENWLDRNGRFCVIGIKILSLHVAQNETLQTVSAWMKCCTVFFHLNTNSSSDGQVGSLFVNFAAKSLFAEENLAWTPACSRPICSRLLQSSPVRASQVGLGPNVVVQVKHRFVPVGHLLILCGRTGASLSVCTCALGWSPGSSIVTKTLGSCHPPPPGAFI